MTKPVESLTAKRLRFCLSGIITVPDRENLMPSFSSYIATQRALAFEIFVMLCDGVANDISGTSTVISKIIILTNLINRFI
jgi:hypothetical protein